MAKRNHSSTPSQERVPEAQRYAQEYGGVRTPGSTAIEPNRLVTPNRERIGTSAMPVPTEGGSAEFMHEAHPANGTRRRGK